MAVDYARMGIRINCVCPGGIDTGFNAPVLEGVSEERLSAMIDAQVPMGRQGSPDEVVAAVLFLLSEDASLITGHALVADAGFTAV
jgi:NAD(P)-dependent dehydrogenase (short-subunit alcohol dehydrogenase family)